ncbi:diacylglycerol kinase [Photobacterium damselae]|uniref:diacylglycerol kinase n=1 Tax=Photobacterium damselae TaxID=38293 RepID=UPI001EFE8A00|nr:diacylglycerol kinase [Photobacterium damselae]MCG9778838.1 diacylglycerol kinase [Photobacterium damselae]
MKPGATGLKRIVDATGYSAKGLKAAWQNEAAFRQEVVLLPILTIITFFLPISVVEQVLMVGSLFVVLIAELLNSAIEAVVDRIGSEYHELSGQAKDLGSAAVFIAMGAAIVTWSLILIL